MSNEIGSILKINQTTYFMSVVEFENRKIQKTTSIEYKSKDFSYCNMESNVFISLLIETIERNLDLNKMTAALPSSYPLSESEMIANQMDIFDDPNNMFNIKDNLLFAYLRTNKHLLERIRILQILEVVIYFYALNSYRNVLRSLDSKRTKDFEFMLDRVYHVFVGDSSKTETPFHIGKYS